MAMQKVTIGAALAVVAVMVVTMSALGALIVSKTISNSGNVKAVGVGVYSDIGCTTSLSSINWGALDPGGSTTSTVYVKNEGNVAVTLSMTVGNWNPASASSYLTLIWNRQNYVLAAGAVVQATLTLAVSLNINGITSFSFDITITGTQ